MMLFVYFQSLSLFSLSTLRHHIYYGTSVVFVFVASVVIFTIAVAVVVVAAGVVDVFVDIGCASDWRSRINEWGVRAGGVFSVLFVDIVGSLQFITLWPTLRFKNSAELRQQLVSQQQDNAKLVQQLTNKGIYVCACLCKEHMSVRACVFACSWLNILVLVVGLCFSRRSAIRLTKSYPPRPFWPPPQQQHKIINSP